MTAEKTPTPAHSGFVFHLMREDEWENLMVSGEHRPASLQLEGFIHCSMREQVIESAAKHFTEDDTLVVAQILVKPIKSILKWEESRDGALFPHLYGPLEIDKVATVRMLTRNKGGEWEWDN